MDKPSDLFSKMDSDDLFEMDDCSPPETPLESIKRLFEFEDKPFCPNLQDVLRKTSDAEIEILGKVLSYWESKPSYLKTNGLRKWVFHKLRKDRYEASLCRTSWPSKSSLGLPEGYMLIEDYEYIDVMMKGEKDDGAPLRLIVDIDFRSQFEVARPTQNFKEIANSLPSIFVGTEKKLDQIIDLVSRAGKQSLKENGLHVPPWRKSKYMHAKWLSPLCKKFSFLPLCI